LYGRQSISGVGSWVAVPSSGGGGGATSDYPTRTSVASSFISTSTSYLRIAGYATPGDGGAALYKRVVTAPSHSGKIQSADGAWWEIAEPQLNIQMFGGKGDNSTDNYPPLLAAYTVINARLGGAVYLPAGQYKFVTSPAFTFAADHFSIRVFGDGAKATSLIFPTTDGLSFTWFAKQNSVHIESMALLTSTNGQKGLSLIFPGANDQPEDNVNSYIQNVTFMGSDNLVEGGANGWGYAFFVDRVSGTNLVNSTVWGGSLITHKGGVGAFYTGATSVFSVGHNIVNFTSANLTDGVLVGTFVQGVQIINSNFSACDNSGVRVAAGGSGLAEVSIQGSQITTIGRAIDIESSIQNISVQNNPYIACTIGGVVTAAGTSVTGIISGNQFIANDAGAGGGIIIDSVSQYGPWGPLNILGNSISGFNFAIVLGANSSGVRSGWNTGLSNNSWDFIDPSSSNNIVLPPA
jgi:hypothetical protein